MYKSKSFARQAAAALIRNSIRVAYENVVIASIDFIVGQLYT